MQALVDAARRKESVLVVGLGPRSPRDSRRSCARCPRPTRPCEFCLGILEAVEPYAAAVKLQAAFFERLGPAGMKIYADLIGAPRTCALPVIADVKRGDIGPVAAAYAEAHLGVYGATCVTVNPYMGEDAVLPFLEEVRRQDRGGGVFVLVATSNPSSARAPGGHRARRSSSSPPGWSRSSADRTATTPTRAPSSGLPGPRSGRRVRELLPDALFLVPGYGAQGGDASAVRPLLDRQGARRPGQQQPRHPLRLRAFGLRLQTSGQRSRPPNARDELPPVEHASPSGYALRTASSLAQTLALAACFRWFGSARVSRVSRSSSSAPRRLPEQGQPAEPKAPLLTSASRRWPMRADKRSAEGRSVLSEQVGDGERSSPALLRPRPPRRKFAPCSLCSCDPFPARVHLFPSLRAVWFPFCGSSVVASSMASLRLFS